MTSAESEGRIGIVGFSPAASINTYWDLGIGDSTAIWFCQQIGKEYRVVDYYEMSGMNIAHYVKHLRKRQQEMGYDYYEHVLPFDAHARELQTGKSRVQALKDLKIGRIRVLPKHSVEDRIEAVRVVLRTCWFNKGTTGRGVDALKSYEKVWDDKNRIFQKMPKHNWASNGADAFGIFAMGVRQEVDQTGLPRHAESDYDILNPAAPVDDMGIWTPKNLPRFQNGH